MHDMTATTISLRIDALEDFVCSLVSLVYLFIIEKKKKKEKRLQQLFLGTLLFLP